jgi:hypothetical protein
MKKGTASEKYQEVDGKKNVYLEKRSATKKTSIEKINQIRGNNQTRHVANGVLKT